MATASPAATVKPPTGSILAPSRLHGMTSASLATSNRAAMIRITGQAMVQRQPQATAITAFSGGPRIDGNSQITAYIASTRGRSASLYSPPMAVSPNAASSPAASPRSTLPASTHGIDGASAENSTPATKTAVATNRVSFAPSADAHRDPTASTTIVASVLAARVAP